MAKKLSESWLTVKFIRLFLLSLGICLLVCHDSDRMQIGMFLFLSQISPWQGWCLIANIHSRSCWATHTHTRMRTHAPFLFFHDTLLSLSLSVSLSLTLSLPLSFHSLFPPSHSCFLVSILFADLFEIPPFLQISDNATLSCCSTFCHESSSFCFWHDESFIFQSKLLVLFF